MSKKERGISPAEIEKKPERLPVKATFSFFDAPLSAKTIIHKLPLEKPLTRRDIEDIVIEITGRGQQEVQESKIVNFIQNVLGFYAYRTQKDLHFYLHLHTIPDQMVTVLHKKIMGTSFSFQDQFLPILQDHLTPQSLKIQKSGTFCIRTSNPQCCDTICL